MKETVTIERIATTPGLAEAPVQVGEDIWFTDLTTGVLRLSPEDGQAELMVARRGVGGLVAHARGGVVASGRSLVHIAPDSTTTELRARPDDSTGFNDLLATSEGEVLAGSLRYRPMAGDAPVPGALMRVTADGMHEVLSGPAWPNGIAQSADNSKTLYLADFAAGVILRIDRGGRVDVLARIDKGSADGLAMDVLGRLWVATGSGGTLVALTPQGRVDRRVTIPAEFVSDIALDPSGGPALVTVGGMVNGRGGLLRVELDAQGVPGHQATIPLPGPDRWSA